MNEASIDERKSVRGGSSGMCASFLFSLQVEESNEPEKAY